jgi:hypothetical protein
MERVLERLAVTEPGQAVPHLSHHASNRDGVFALRVLLVGEVEGTNYARSPFIECISAKGLD